MTIQKSNYFKDIWKSRKEVSEKDINYNDGEAIDFKWIFLEEYAELYDKEEIVPSDDFVIKMLQIRELEEER